MIYDAILLFQMHLGLDELVSPPPNGHRKQRRFVEYTNKNTQR